METGSSKNIYERDIDIVYIGILVALETYSISKYADKRTLFLD